MDAVNTQVVTAKECADLSAKLFQLAERAGGKLQLEKAAFLKRAANNLKKAAEIED